MQCRQSGRDKRYTAFPSVLANVAFGHLPNPKRVSTHGERDIKNGIVRFFGVVAGRGEDAARPLPSTGLQGTVLL